MHEKIKKGMEVIGADSVYIGTVDEVSHHRMKLSRKDNARGHEHHDHYIDLKLIADIEDRKIRLSANADVAITFEEEESGKPV